MSTSDLLRILDEPVTVRRLDNGLTVIVRPDQRSPVVALVTLVRAGYLDESDALVGISHVLEHMYFKGTSRRGPGAIARETRDAGGYLNASTSYERTLYYTVLPARALQQGMDVQSDALRDSLVDADELARELRVIIEEAKRKRDTPTALARETMYASLFDAHRMRRWRIGTEDQLAGYGRDDVRGFYRAWYHPGNIVVAIAGAVTAAEAIDLAARYYGDLPAGEVPVPDAPVEPERHEFRYRALTGEVARSYIEAGWRGPAIDDPEAPALGVLATVLGDGRASRLYREVREAGHAFSISASSFGTRDIGVFGVSAETAPDVLPALRAIGSTLDRVRAHGVASDEVERARRLIGARALRQLETVEGQANFLADWQARGDWRAGVDWLRRALETSPEALVEGARRLAPDSAAVVVYAANDSDLPDAEQAASALATQAVAAAPGTGPVPVARPTGRADFDREEDGVRFYRTSDAAIAVQPMRTGLATIAIAFPGGSVEEELEQAGITSLAMRLTPKGTRRRGADEIARLTESLGGVVHADADADRFEWRITVPAGAVSSALALLGEIVCEPAFEPETVERERAFALQDTARVRDDMYRYPLSQMLSTAWFGHPYGFSIAHVEAGLRRTNATAIREWFERRTARRPWIVVVGDVDADSVAAAGAGLPLRDGATELRTRAPTWPPKPVESRAGRQRAQTGIAIGLPGPARDHDDRYALGLAGAAVAGLGGRVFEELRSRRSLAYVVSLRPLARKVAGAFVGYIATSPEREEEARTELLAEMLRLASDGVEEDELARARRYALGIRDIRRQTTAAVAADLVGALVLGDGVRELREYRARIEAVTPDHIRAAARRWFRSDAAITGVVQGTPA